jgi:F-type H+-transporting ATPase subunit gamma
VGNLRDIRRRITSVKSTQQITSAMKMVSAAKLRRAQQAIENARPYAERMRATLEEVASGSGDAEHPLFAARDEVRGLEIMVVTSDRGLAGGFNNNILKLAEAVLAEREDEVESISLTLVGKRAGDYFKRRRRQQIRVAEPTGSEITYAQAAEIAQTLAKRFETGEIDEVILIYSEFKSVMTQVPRQVQLLPFASPETEEGEEDQKLPYEIEPDPKTLLGTLVPKAVETEVFRALLENQAGEHAARMTAMEGATKNTEELIEKLTLQYNRARQAAITRELVEIVTGAQALE